MYDFWGQTITGVLNQVLLTQPQPALINLASDEYYKSVRPAQLQSVVITPVFEDFKNTDYKIISFYAKRARGLMARYAIDHQINDPHQLKNFDVEGYRFMPDISDERRWIYRRKL